MENSTITYENIKAKIAQSGVVSVINGMFGSHLTCDSAVMFGEKPIDDKLLYEIGNVVCLAARDGKLTKDDVQAVMAPVYELHSKIDNYRFDTMVEKGRIEAYAALSNDKIRSDIDKFKQVWGDECFIESVNFAKYGNERRKALPFISNNILPEMFSVCGVYPEYEIETEKHTGQYANAWYVIKDSRLSLFFRLFLTDKACSQQTALELLATVAHELHHCSQDQNFYNIRVKTPCDYWCVSPLTGKIPAEVVWERALSADYPVARRRNPLEQEAYTVESAFKYCLNEYYNSDGNGERNSFVASLKKPFDEKTKGSIDKIVVDRYNHMSRMEYCRGSIRYR